MAIVGCRPRATEPSQPSRSPGHGSSADRPRVGATAEEQLPGQPVLNVLRGEGRISASVDGPPGAKVELILATVTAVRGDRGRIAPGFAARDHAEPMCQRGRVTADECRRCGGADAGRWSRRRGGSRRGQQRRGEAAPECGGGDHRQSYESTSANPSPSGGARPLAGRGRPIRRRGSAESLPDELRIPAPSVGGTS